MHDDLYEALNHCFDDTLRHRFQRAVEKELGVIGTFEDASSSTTEEPPTELEDWEYWSMKDSVLFCFTVITTIGYGNVAPQTTRGRLFVIFYGLIGVPLTMLVIANLGKFLAQMLKNFMKGVRKVLRKLWRSLRRLCVYRSKEKRLLSPSDSERTELPTLRTMETTESEVSSEDGEENVHQNAAELFIAFVIYIALGSLAISLYEPEMDYFKAIYFNFVTLTTIGLGDIIPESERYLPFTLIYCAIGLALTTSAIEIAADYLKRLHYFGRKLDHVENVSIWFGAKKLTMKQLVKNLGDQFNLPEAEIENLNIDQFVDAAIKVESGEIETLRQPLLGKPISAADFRNAGRVPWIDEDAYSNLSKSIDERLTLRGD
ncbi:Protein EGL-23 a [Aphelenchoides avenae]|nr:Protein EGL-23 a [Aphelenchus avenae]